MLHFITRLWLHVMEYDIKTGGEEGNQISLPAWHRDSDKCVVQILNWFNMHDRATAQIKEGEWSNNKELVLNALVVKQSYYIELRIDKRQVHMFNTRAKDERKFAIF